MRPGPAFLPILAVAGIAFPIGEVRAQSSAEELARSLQDPLASISALMTDNTINFDTGPGNDPGYDFQLQPVYSFPFERVNLIPRAVIPILGVPGGADFPDLGLPQPPGPGTRWGLGDITAQLFVDPKLSTGSWKFGAGPQVSFRTRTDSRLAGAGWGAGPAGVVVTSFGDWSFAGIVSQHWGFDGDFSLFSLQPMIFYNLPFLPGAALFYNNSMTADWKASSSNTWTVPLGLGAGQTFDLGGGWGVDLSLGAYGVAVRPAGGPSWQLKFGITLIVPRWNSDPT